MRYVFEILYYLCLYDMNEDFLVQLFELLINEADSSKRPLRELASGLIVRLSNNLPMMQSTHFLRMPYQSNLEPMEYLLRSSSTNRASSKTSKWKVNLEYETPKSPLARTESLFGSPVKVNFVDLNEPIDRKASCKELTVHIRHNLNWSDELIKTHFFRFFSS